MNTSSLIQFINRYDLASAESDGAKWKVSPTGTLMVRFTSADHSCFGYIEAPDSHFPTGDFYISDTDKLKSMLMVLDDEYSVSCKTDANQTPIAFVIGDKRTKVSYALGDVRNAQKHQFAEKEIDASFVMLRATLDVDVVKSLLRSRSALKEVETVTLWSDGNISELIVGYEQRQNSNRVTLGFNTDQTTSIPHINFQIKYVADILQVNKDADARLLEIIEIPGNSPFMRLTCVGDSFKAVYIVNQKDL